jgi:hypothetical protein
MPAPHTPMKWAFGCVEVIAVSESLPATLFALGRIINRALTAA